MLDQDRELQRLGRLPRRPRPDRVEPAEQRRVPGLDEAGLIGEGEAGGDREVGARRTSMSAADDEREGMPRAALRAISASLFSRSRAEDRGIRRGAVARIHVVEEREIEAAAPALQGVVAIVFTLQVFSLFFLVNPSVGEYVLLAVFGYVVLSALIFALAATGLGLAAALIHGLRAEGSRRQAFAGGLAVLAGVLAVLLSVDVPVAIVWHLFGS